MSQENVENAHRVYDAFNRRDLDAVLAFVDPEVEFKVRFMDMQGRAYLRGHDGIREWWQGVLAVFPDFKIEVLEARDPCFPCACDNTESAGPLWGPRARILLWRA